MGKDSINADETDSQSAEIPRKQFLASKVVQIQAVAHPGDSNCGPHVQVFSLCADGSIWIRYDSSGFSNVPTDGLWRMIQPPDGWQYSSAKKQES